MGKTYRPKDKPNKREIPRRKGPYPVIRKVSPLAYELDIPVGTKIHPVVSIAYLSRYRSHEDPFQRVPPPPGPIEYDNSDTSGDSEQKGKHWELERIVAHDTKRGQTQYLVRWKGYGPKEDKWMKTSQLKHAKQLLAEYQERRRRTEALTTTRRRTRARWTTAADGPSEKK